MIFIPIISIPKSGTHFMMEIVRQLYEPYHCHEICDAFYVGVNNKPPHKTYTFDLADTENRLLTLDKKCSCMDLTSHMFYDEKVANFFERKNHVKVNIRPVFMYRDPRDIIVSFILGMEANFPPAPRIIQGLTGITDKQERFRKLVDIGITHEGLPGGFTEELECWKGWYWARSSTYKSILQVSYERLMNKDPELISELADWFQVENYIMYHTIQSAMHFKTATYRKGQIKAWQSEFDRGTVSYITDRLQDLISLFGKDA